uniref:ATPase n=2 Tax=unclassified Prevotella TaxID=2638335 RepID=A0AB33JHT4_9BACT
MSQLLLIADSGSTKTDWCLVEDGRAVRRIPTKGMNPFFQSSDEMAVEIRQYLLPELPDKRLAAVYFYGAGCTPQKSPEVEATLRDSLSVDGAVEAHSDLLAAARSLCGHHPGIASILGTGSNSCFFDGKDIVQNTPALGFILGDEGSGAYLGKRLVGDILKGQMSSALKDSFFQQFGLSQADIIERVYRQPFPSRFLASLNIFLEQHRDDAAVHQLLIESFTAFVKRNILHYDYRHHPLSCIGTIAHVYRQELTEAAAALGVQMGIISKTPMEGLIAYHGLDLQEE